MANFFARTLLSWHHAHHRPLPWGDNERDPYHIWLSEIIMQQTRISQGAGYYLRFVERFPSVFDLSVASIDDIMRLWQGLGYYTRARNLHKAAIYIVRDLNGHFPDSFEGLLALPGVGPYSAAAISSFAYGLPHAVVDGNVKRVIARFAGITQSIDVASTQDKIHELASGFMKDASPALFNQAIMNFGALVCKPQAPLCSTCPLSKRCFALRHDMVDALPVRSKKKVNRVRYFHFVRIEYRGKILLRRREEKDIWQGLYVLPFLEKKSSRSLSVSQINTFVTDLLGPCDYVYKDCSKPVLQQLSHQTISGRFILLTLLASPRKLSEEYVWAAKRLIHTVAKPKMIADFLEQ